MPNHRYFNRLDQLPGFRTLPAGQRQTLQTVTERFAFRCSDYYQSLIDWTDPEDPIRRIVIPQAGELREWGHLDPSGEADYAVAPGLEHKYPDTVILLANGTCGALCRFCFRKRPFMKGNSEVTRNLEQAFEYITAHPQISNVLVTGGDPLLLSTRRLTAILQRLRAMDHVRIIRLGSKMAAFNPYRILDDPALLEALGAAARPGRSLYFMAHFNHPRELTEPAREALLRLQRAGVTVMNQSPLIRGVNDDPAILAELFSTLAVLGVAPYYLFQCRPTAGNADYAVPLEAGQRIFQAAQQRCSGLARRLRFVMSHRSGKVEILGAGPEQVYFRYHRAARPEDEGRILVFPRNPGAYWLDDYRPDRRGSLPRPVAGIRPGLAHRRRGN